MCQVPNAETTGDPLPQKGSDAGFSLIELLIATLILITGLLSVTSLLLFALSANYSTRIEATALRLSQQKVEELRSLPLNHAQLVDSTESLDPNANVDFAATATHSATQDILLNQTKQTKLVFETRWHVITDGARKIVTVATRNIGGTSAQLRPANLKLVRISTVPALGL